MQYLPFLRESYAELYFYYLEVLNFLYPFLFKRFNERAKVLFGRKYAEVHLIRPIIKHTKSMDVIKG
jgi:hypothetical protein